MSFDYLQREIRHEAERRYLEVVAKQRRRQVWKDIAIAAVMLAAFGLAFILVSCGPDFRAHGVDVYLIDGARTSEARLDHGVEIMTELLIERDLASPRQIKAMYELAMVHVRPRRFDCGGTWTDSCYGAGGLVMIGESQRGLSHEWAHLWDDAYGRELGHSDTTLFGASDSLEQEGFRRIQSGR